ncbi:Transcriptional modulator WTM2 [Nakaseomyces bracarensis]|uniref:Transcriptional modulator WTM2 n=1 Tax=Nakaseomyces bracarensis TaxID=273131 RepID=A0ABR4NVC4_9SACH
MIMTWNKVANYEHISSMKPRFISRAFSPESQQKSVAFSNELIPDTDNGVLKTKLLYSQGSDIFELDCSYPLIYGDEGDENPKEPVQEYGDAFKDMENVPLTTKWVYQGETVSKMRYLGEEEDANMIAMSKNGSLAWFTDGVKVPVHIVQEMMGPSTKFSSIHSLTRNDELAVADFDLSVDQETIVKSQSSGNEEDSILKLVDNDGKPSEVLRTIRVPGTTVTHSVRFLDNHVFASCSDDNVIRFWDTRTAEKPLWSLCDPQNGSLTAFDVSQLSGNLFVTGFSTGIIKLWDARAVENATLDLTHRQNGEEPIQKEIANLYHAGGDTVVDLKFSYTTPTEFLSVGGNGNVYHWDAEYALSKYDPEDLDFEPQEATEELLNESLKFLHTGGSRRNPSAYGSRNTVAWHPVIEGLVAHVDPDTLITTYLPYDN